MDGYNFSVTSEVKANSGSAVDTKRKRFLNASRLHRRSSLAPSHFLLPPSTILSMGFKSAGTEDKRVSIDSGSMENIPLLGPLVPRVEEAGDEDDTKSNTFMFWEELHILSKYTLPLFGYVSLLYLLPVN